jgi:hypothetical protein
MDILSHGLWAAAAAKGTKLSAPKIRKINPWFAAFWGMFPDLFAFCISFVWILVKVVSGQFDRSIVPNPENLEPAATSQLWPMRLSLYLYNYSHSVVIFFSVLCFIVVLRYLIQKRPLLQILPFEMFGWLLHILCDIPTHSYKFYPTPIFWPLWGWKFNGFSWGVWWFMLLNYSLLALAFVVIKIKTKKKV